MATPWNGMRAMNHITFLIAHYFLHFKNDLEFKPDTLSVPKNHLLCLISYFSFMIYFVLSGISSGKCLTKKIELHCSFKRISFQFYWDRLSIIVPITYIYYLTFSMAFFFIFNQNQIRKMFIESLLANLLFISNYFSIESNVIS